MSLFKIDPPVQCKRSPKCLRRDAHEGDCGGFRAMLRDIAEKQGNHIAQKILDAIGHEVKP